MKNSSKNLALGTVFMCAIVSIRADVERFNEGMDDTFGGAAQVAYAPVTMWRRGDGSIERQEGETGHEYRKRRSRKARCSDENCHRRPIRRGLRNIGQGTERSVYGAGEVATSPFVR